ncbi:XdhC family protein [Alkalinema sp. FACHB-956]|nr:XdhC family protein [Alkalinema sp. FACHB-956]
MNIDPPKSPLKRGTLNIDPPKSPLKRGTLINNNPVPPLFLALAARSAGARGNQNCEGEALDAFVEVIQPQPTVLIIGAGHCGIQLAKVADIAGFQVMVQDDRRDWANADHYPQATRIFTTSIAETIAQLNHHSALYIALLTRGYQHDVQALQAIMTKAIPCHYIGMMGSQRRVQQVLQAVQAQVAQEFSELSELQISQWLQHIHAPIGLDIGALTPEEIAVSITAEMIQIRRRDRDQKCSP